MLKSKSHKKIVSVIVSTALLTTSVLTQGTYTKASMEPVSVTKGNYCGDITYTYFKDDTTAEDTASYLLFEGSGAMKNIENTGVISESGGYTQGTSQLENQPWMQNCLPDDGLDSYGNEYIDTKIYNDKTFYPLTEIIVGENITDLGVGTFANYSTRRPGPTIRLGKNITKLPREAFQYTRRCSIYLYGTAEREIDENAFIRTGTTTSTGNTMYFPTEEMKATFETYLTSEAIGWTEKEVTKFLFVKPSLKVDSSPLYLAVAKGKIEKKLHIKDEVYDNTYPEDKWNAMLEALADGEAAVAAEDEAFANSAESTLTEETVATKAKAINDAIEAMSDSDSKYDDLQSKIDEAKRIKPEKDYSKSSWQKLQTAINDAAQLGREEDNEKYETAIANLDTAINGMVKITEYSEVLANAETVDLESKSSHTKASWDAFITAFENAKAMPDDATQETVDSLTSALKAAQEGLVTLDLTAIQKEVATWKKNAEDEERMLESYTAESYKKLKEAYDAAKEVAELTVYEQTKVTTQEEIDALLAALVDAERSLVELDATEAKQELKAYVEEVKAAGYQESDYTAETWQEYATALKLAESTANRTSNTLISIIKDRQENLKAAVANLKKQEREEGVYLEYTGSWIKQGKENKMQGYAQIDSEAVLKTTDWWMEISGLDLSGMENPVLEVEYTADGDTLQISANTTGTAGWNDNNPVLTSGTENTGKSKFKLDKDYKYILLTSNAMYLEYSKVKIYDDKAGLAQEILTASVDKANKLKEADYTAETWKVFKAALEAAAKISDSSTEEEITAADTALKKAMEGLKKAEVKNVTPDTTNENKNDSTKNTDSTKKTAVKGTTFTSGQLVYKVTNAASGKCAVAVKAPKSKKVRSVTIPATVKKAGITYKVTSIADNAFKNCKKLKKVTIGKNVTSIGKSAFYNAKALKKITVKATKLKKVGKKALKGINKKAVVKVPKKSLKKYKRLFKNKGQKKTVKIKK